MTGSKQGLHGRDATLLVVVIILAGVLAGIFLVFISYLLYRMCGHGRYRTNCNNKYQMAVKIEDGEFSASQRKISDNHGIENSRLLSADSGEDDTEGVLVVSNNNRCIMHDQCEQECDECCQQPDGAPSVTLSPETDVEENIDLVVQVYKAEQELCDNKTSKNLLSTTDFQCSNDNKILGGSFESTFRRPLSRQSPMLRVSSCNSEPYTCTASVVPNKENPHPVQQHSTESYLTVTSDAPRRCSDYGHCDQLGVNKWRRQSQQQLQDNLQDFHRVPQYHSMEVMSDQLHPSETHERKARSFDLVAEAANFISEQFREMDDELSVVRYNDTGSLEDVQENQQMLDEILVEDAPKLPAGYNSSDPKDLWKLRQCLEKDKMSHIQKSSGQQNKSPAVKSLLQLPSNTTAVDVSSGSPTQSAQDARRQHFRSAFAKRSQRVNVSGETSLDSFETTTTDPEREASGESRGHITTSLESTDSTSDSHTSKLQQMQRDSGYKSVESAHDNEHGHHHHQIIQQKSHSKERTDRRNTLTKEPATQELCSSTEITRVEQYKRYPRIPHLLQRSMQSQSSIQPKLTRDFSIDEHTNKIFNEFLKLDSPRPLEKLSPSRRLARYHTDQSEYYENSSHHRQLFSKPDEYLYHQQHSKKFQRSPQFHISKQQSPQHVSPAHRINHPVHHNLHQYRSHTYGGNGYASIDEESSYYHQHRRNIHIIPSQNHSISNNFPKVMVSRREVR